MGEIARPSGRVLRGCLRDGVPLAVRIKCQRLDRWVEFIVGRFGDVVQSSEPFAAHAQLDSVDQVPHHLAVIFHELPDELSVLIENLTIDLVKEEQGGVVHTPAPPPPLEVGWSLRIVLRHDPSGWCSQSV